MDCSFSVLSKIPSPGPGSWRCSLTRIIVLHFTPEYMIHFETVLKFLYKNARFRSRFNYLLENIQLSQQRLLLRLIFLHWVALKPLSKKNQLSPRVWVYFYTSLSSTKLLMIFFHYLFRIQSGVWFSFSFLTCIICIFSFFPLIILARDISISLIILRK